MHCPTCTCKGVRTTQQNRALHLFCTLVAKALNDAGISLQQLLSKAKVEIPCTKDNIKENLWRPIQKAVLKKHSTRELGKHEVDEVYDVINRFLSDFELNGRRYHIHVPWPSYAEGWESAPLLTDKPEYQKTT